LASEVVHDREQLGLVLDLSPGGLRLERRFFGRRNSNIVQLEFVLPEVEELVWAKGEICFDRLRPTPAGPIRSTGLRLVAATSRHLRFIKDWVMATAEIRARLASFVLEDDSCRIEHVSSKVERVLQNVERVTLEPSADEPLLCASHWCG
jgi:hypothetical protein